MATTTIAVVDYEGKKTASITLPEALFDVDTNIPLLHQVVVAQLAAARQGTAKVKTRAEVSGAGRKPFKQKGTGRARQGSIRAPQMTGGGIVHGPVPRDYSQRTPKKMIAAALLGALSDRARAGRISAVTGLTADQTPSTKTARAALANVTSGRRALLVVPAADSVDVLSARNLANLHILTVGQLNAYDVLVADDLVFTADALDQFIQSKTVAQEGVQA